MGGQIRSWMKKYASKPMVLFDRTFHRLNKLDDLKAQSSFDARLRAGLQPAPHLRAVISHVIAQLERASDDPSHHGGPQRFHCLQLTQADVKKNGQKAFVLAARIMVPTEPTLLVDASLSSLARDQM